MISVVDNLMIIKIKNVSWLRFLAGPRPPGNGLPWPHVKSPLFISLTFVLYNETFIA